eukprot:jgi/Ulvmu1/8008/UM004_0244.1
MDNTDALPDDREHKEFLDLTHNLTDISMSQMKKDSDQEIAAEYDTPEATEMRCTSDEAGPPPSQTKPVPHYLSKTIYRQDRTFRWLFAFSVLFSVAYFAVRVVYIVTGKVKVGLPADASSDQIKSINRQNQSAIIYSSIVLVAEFGGFLLIHLGQQMFTRQHTRFGKMTDANVERMKLVVQEKGILQRIHVIVCTYAEPAATVERCVQHLLDSPLPVYAERIVWVADDGHALPEGAGKRAFVERMRAQGHSVVYVGDRSRRRGQLNGKSSNLNHVILNKIYPHVAHADEVSWKDVISVMDCDHLVRPPFFQKCCAVLLDKDVAVCLTPQSFHNTIHPDFFDNANHNFMFRLMPYYFGAGCCFITGTNVLIRARAIFLACNFGQMQARRARFWHLRKQIVAAPRGRQLFSEELIAEDVDLGSRIHALGFKSVFLDEILARGEVPHAPRDFWKQRARWAKASHLYVLDRHSVFWKAQPYMSLYQKSLYGLPLLLHFTVVFTEPIMFTLPLVCLGFDICPYGMDIWLWVTHFMRLLLTFLVCTHADSLSKRFAALNTLTASRVLFFVNVKAVVNTIMVYLRWKRPGAFKVTRKAEGAEAASPVDSGSGGGAYVMRNGTAVAASPPGRRAEAVGESDQSQSQDRYDASFWEEVSGSVETTICTEDDGTNSCVVRVSTAPDVHTPSAAELEAVPATAYPAASWDESDKGSAQEAHRGGGGGGGGGGTNMTASERAMTAAPMFPEESSTVSAELYGRPPPLHPSDSCSVAYVTPCTTGTIGPVGGEGYTQGSLTSGTGYTLETGVTQSTARVTVAGASGSAFLDALTARGATGAPVALRRNQSALPMGAVARGGGMRRSQSVNERRGRVTLTRVRSSQTSNGNTSAGSTAARSKSKSNLSVVRTVPQRHVWGGRGGSVRGGTHQRSGGNGSRRNGSGTTNVYVPPNSSAGSDSIQSSPASESTSPPQNPPLQREQSAPVGSVGAYIPPPPPGYAYSIVPASSPAALIVGGAAGTAHMPHPLPSVQEGLPVSPSDYDNSPDTMPWLMQGDSPDVPYMDATNSICGNVNGGGDTAARAAAYPAHAMLDSEGRASAVDSTCESTIDSAAVTDDDEVPELPQDVAAAAGVRAPFENSGMLDSSFLGTYSHVNRPLIAGAPGPVAEQDESAAPGCGCYGVHDGLSRVTETRRRCLPYDGTLDFPVIFIITAINIIAISLGTAKLAAEGEIISLRGTEEQNVKMIALVLGLVEAMPGVMFLWYMATFRCCRWTLWVVVPLTLTIVGLLVAFMEVRVGLQYVSTAFGVNWQLPDCSLNDCKEFTTNKG